MCFRLLFVRVFCVFAHLCVVFAAVSKYVVLLALLRFCASCVFLSLLLGCWISHCCLTMFFGVLLTCVLCILSLCGLLCFVVLLSCLLLLRV